MKAVHTAEVGDKCRHHNKQMKDLMWRALHSKLLQKLNAYQYIEGTRLESFGHFKHVEDGSEYVEGTSHAPVVSNEILDVLLLYIELQVEDRDARHEAAENKDGASQWTVLWTL